MCKKQIAVSHRSAESAIFSLDARVRMDGLPALLSLGEESEREREDAFCLRCVQLLVLAVTPGLNHQDMAKTSTLTMLSHHP